MRKLNSFTFITLNGFYKGANEDIGWHKQFQGEEENKYSSDSMKSDNVLLFGRTTYEMMASWWTSEEAKKQMPELVEGINKADKIVFSKTLQHAGWENTKVISGDLIAEVNKLKQESQKDLTILGSGSVLAQLAEFGLVNEFKIMIDPIVIPSGTTLFNTIKEPLRLKFISGKSFKSGSVLVRYHAKEND
jgi:dihydrofolate reductase